MENMRRATIYAEGNPAVAAELLWAVVERTETKPVDARAEALEWFDVGYLVESRPIGSSTSSATAGSAGAESRALRRALTAPLLPSLGMDVAS